MIEVFSVLIEALKTYVQVYGGIGVFLAMIIQAILVIIPSEGVLLLAGSLMNPWSVALWAGFGSIAGASISFWIGKKGGRPIVKKLLGEATLNFIDNWVKKWGNKSILIGRLIPFVPYDPISYISGATKIKFKDFSIWNAIGTFPRAIMFAFLGSFFFNFEIFGMIFVIALCVLILVANFYIKKKYSSTSVSVKK